MPNETENRPNQPLARLPLRPIEQISESHCGPAVIQMLLENLGVISSQEAITLAGDAEKTIESDGMRIDQLAQAVNTLAPETTFWYKDHAHVQDIIDILRERFPVGVEWQGIFDSPEEELEADEADYGHYSVITHIDTEKNSLIVVDPYKDFVSSDRIITISEFKKRWWDTNAIIDLVTGKERFIEDNRMLFIITPAEITFPRELGLLTYE